MKYPLINTLNCTDPSLQPLPGLYVARMLHGELDSADRRFACRLRWTLSVWMRSTRGRSNSMAQLRSACAVRLVRENSARG